MFGRLLLFFDGGVVLRMELLGLVSLGALMVAERCVSYGAAIVLVGRVVGCLRCRWP